MSETEAGVEVQMFRQVVSYPKTDGGFRYRVVPSENRLELPDTGEDLPGWAEEQEWSWAGPEPIRMPDGETVEAPMLGAYVGDWPTGYSDRARRQTGKYARRMHVEKQLWVEANVFEPLGLTGKNEAPVRMQNRRQVERSVFAERKRLFPVRSHVDVHQTATSDDFLLGTGPRTCGWGGRKFSATDPPP